MHETDLNEPENGLVVVAEFDYSDAPNWALPREWFIEGRYELEEDWAT